MLSDTASTWPSTLTVVDTTTFGGGGGRKGIGGGSGGVGGSPPPRGHQRSPVPRSANTAPLRTTRVVARGHAPHPPPNQGATSALGPPSPPPKSRPIAPALSPPPPRAVDLAVLPELLGAMQIAWVVNHVKMSQLSYLYERP